MRSAKAPVMSAGVMMANINWNTMKVRWGIDPFGSIPTPFMKAYPNPPDEHV